MKYKCGSPPAQRADAAHHVHSKLLAWLALDRALRIGATHRLSSRQRRRWQGALDQLGTEIRSKGVDPDRNCCTRTCGFTDLDAALLVLPLIGLEDPASTVVRTTIDEVWKELGAGGPLLYRYPPGQDGLEGGEGAFQGNYPQCLTHATMVQAALAQRANAAT